MLKRYRTYNSEEMETIPKYFPNNPQAARYRLRNAKPLGVYRRAGQLRKAKLYAITDLNRIKIKKHKRKTKFGYIISILPQTDHGLVMPELNVFVTLDKETAEAICDDLKRNGYQDEHGECFRVIDTTFDRLKYRKKKT